MKFVIPSLTLLSASAAFGASIYRRDVSEECFNASVKVEDDFHKKCLLIEPSVRENYNDFELSDDKCNAFNSDECQKIIKTNWTDLPECKGSDKTGPIFTSRNELLLIETSKVLCTKDESNQFCKFGEKRYVDGDYEMTPVENFADVCKSQKCTQAYLNYLESAKKIITDEVKANANQYPGTPEQIIESTLKDSFNYNNAVAALKADTCGKSAASSAPAAGASSGSSSSSSNASSSSDSSASSANASSGNAQAGNAQAGAQAGNTQTGNAQAGNAQAGNASNNANATSDASIMTYTNSLFVAVVLLMVTLF